MPRGNPSVFHDLFGFAIAGLLWALLPATSQAAQPAPDRSTARFEINFMQDMIDHHAMAVEMARMCQEKAEDLLHEDLLALCGQIVTSQESQIDTLQGWLQDWYGKTYEPRLEDGQMRDLEALTGAEFEVAFMVQMIGHHREAIDEASGCLVRAYHPDLIELCGAIIVEQAPEIVEMRTWLCQWYDLCLLRKHQHSRVKGASFHGREHSFAKH
jgi:uncharacterized protein (DUF305 family)